MKVRQGIVIAIVALMLFAFVPNEVVAQSGPLDEIVYLEFRREATVLTFGTVTTDDTYLVLNNGTTSVSETIVYYPKAFLNLLTFRKALEASEAELLLTIEEGESLERFLAYKVTFATPLAPGEQYRFIIRSEYHDLFFLRDPALYQEGSEQEFEMDYYWFPLVDAPMQIAASRITTRQNTIFFDVPTNAVFVSEQDLSYIEFIVTEIDPLTYAPIVVKWIDNLQAPIEYTRFEREIEIDTWGFITVNEIHQIRNLGYFEQQAISIEYNIDMMNWSLYGEFGQYVEFKQGLGVDAEDPGVFLHSQQSELEPHIFIIQLRYKLQHLDTYTLFFSYRIPLTSLQEFEGLVAKLDYPSRNNGFWVAREHVTKVTLPHGSAILDFAEAPTQIIHENGFTTFVYRDFNTTPNLILDLQISYIPNYITMFTRPLLFTFIVGLIAALYVSMRRVSYEEAPRVIQQEGMPKSLLAEYSELYDEKVALVLQIEKFDDDRKRKKVSKREYDTRRRRYSATLKEVNRKIKDTTDQIKEYGGRLAEIVEELAILEAERDNIRVAITDLNRRYRARRVTRAVYERLRRDQERKINRSTSRIDTLIFELRQSAQ